MNFAVFASGNGSNLQAIIDAIKKKTIKANLKLVVSDHPKAYALVRAKRAKIATLIVEPKDYPDRVSFDREIIDQLKKKHVDFIVLAGFMRILSPIFIKAFKGKILNVHPALLPAFKGAHAIKDAFDCGVKVTGVTVHFVDEQVDHGAIICQQAVAIDKKDTPKILEKKIHHVEHIVYPKAIDLFARGKLKVIGRLVRIL